MNKLIAIDAGNGYTKRLYNDKITTEPTVYAETRLQPNGSHPGLMINGRERKYFGTNAVRSPYLTRQAVGETDRYTSTEYIDIVIATIASEFENDITVDLVLGLPSHHFAPCRETLKSTFANTTHAVTGDKTLTITIDNVLVVPQPLGTYVIAANPHDRVLIVDGGHGTVDFSTFKNSELLRQDSINQGMKFVYSDILVALKRRYPTAEITILDIPEILESGLQYRGETIKVVDDEVRAILNDHFAYICERIRAEYGSYDAFDRIIFTGGMAEVYKLEILSSGVYQFRIADQPSTANVRGYAKLGGSVFNG